MVRKITGLYKPNMVRPIIYKTATKLSFALLAVQLWNRWINTKSLMSLRDGYFAVGLIVLMLSWFSYLKLDGINVHLWTEKKEKKKKHRMYDIIDFADEKITSYDELEPDEQIACKLASSIITGVLLLMVSLGYVIFL
jgi:hypothetical protein